MYSTKEPGVVTCFRMISNTCSFQKYNQDNNYSFLMITVVSIAPFRMKVSDFSFFLSCVSLFQIMWQPQLSSSWKHLVFDTFCDTRRENRLKRKETWIDNSTIYPKTPKLSLSRTQFLPFLIQHLSPDLTRVTWRVSLVEQKLLTLPEHIGSSRGFLCCPCYLIFSCLCSAL